MDEEVGLLLASFLFGGMVALLIVVGFTNGFTNVNVDVGLSQESADLVCQKITNNSNAIAIDWDQTQDEPEDSLICDLTKERVDGGLIQVIDNQ